MFVHVRLHCGAALFHFPISVHVSAVSLSAATVPSLQQYSIELPGENSWSCVESNNNYYWPYFNTTQILLYL